jgi:hypothetical protein
MARPLATEETLSRRDDVAESEKVGGGEGKRFQKKPRDANRIDARDESFVTSLDDASLRSWLPVGAKADIVVVRRVTGFHLGLNANRWLKIRMREIADGVGRVGFFGSRRKNGGENERLRVARFVLPRHGFGPRPLRSYKRRASGRFVRF